MRTYRTGLSLPLAGLLSLTSLSSHLDEPRLAQEQTAARAETVRDEIRAIENYCGKLDQDVDGARSASRLFVEVVAEGGWRELTREGNIPQSEIIATARVWFKANAPLVVEYVFATQSRDLHSALYYFRSDGTLAKIHSHLRTSCSNLITTHETIYDAGGKVLKHFSLMWSEATVSESNHPPTTVSAEDPSPVYFQSRDLPFYILLR